MYQLDDAAREYFQDAFFFSDVFNFRVFGGEQVLRPEMLKPLPESASAGLGASRRRDLLKRAVFRCQDGVTYAVLGIENQAAPDHIMALRSLMYDVLSYDSQFREIADRNRRENRPGRDFLTDLCPDDRVAPVVTQVVYWSHLPWTAPRSLHELLDFQDPRLKAFTADYRLNLLEPYKIGEDDFGKFRTTLGDMLHYVKVRHKWRTALEFVENSALFRNLDPRSLNLLCALFPARTQEILQKHISNLKPTKEGGIDMVTTVKSITDLWREQGYEEGREEGREEERAEGAQRMARLLQNTGLPQGNVVSMLCQGFSLTEEQARGYLAQV